MHTHPSFEIISRYVDKELSEKEALALREHLKSCEKCRRTVEILDATAQATRPARERLDALSAKVMEAVTQHEEQRAEKSAAQSKVSSIPPYLKRRTPAAGRKKSGWAQRLALAAAALVGVVMVVALPQLDKFSDRSPLVYEMPSEPSPASPSSLPQQPVMDLSLLETEGVINVVNGPQLIVRVADVNGDGNGDLTASGRAVVGNGLPNPGSIPIPVRSQKILRRSQNTPAQNWGDAGAYEFRGKALKAYTYDSAKGYTSAGDVYQIMAGGDPGTYAFKGKASKGYPSAVGQGVVNTPSGLTRETLAQAYLGQDSGTFSAQFDFLDRSDPWNRQVNNNAPGSEAYAPITHNPFLNPRNKPLSTFSIDVDTASYSNMRRFLTDNQRPPKDSVRIEEMINYFSYDYPPPAGDKPFSVEVEINDCPWNSGRRLARIGLKGEEIQWVDRVPGNLVFLLDVSGSMNSAKKLPFVKKSLQMLAENLGEYDCVSIVVYAGASGLVLEPTYCDNPQPVLDAIERLKSGGSTNGGQGIELAYKIAEENLIEGGINRVILATDGDFNVGVTDRDALIALIEEKAKSGVFLTVLGFGEGNLKDATMEQLADKGNGNYAYIDTLREAQKVMIEQISGTMITIAKDVKIQVEFNPAVVDSYRLIGYENRVLAARDFNDDTKDAGEIGAGLSVTALYEITPAGMGDATAEDRSIDGRKDEDEDENEEKIADTDSFEDLMTTEVGEVDPLRYQQPGAVTAAMGSGETLTVKLRYKEPDEDTSKLLEFPIVDEGRGLALASEDFKFASAVAAFGMILRDSPYKGDATIKSVLALAKDGLGEDARGYREEFIALAQSEVLAPDVITPRHQLAEGETKAAPPVKTVMDQATPKVTPGASAELPTSPATTSNSTHGSYDNTASDSLILMGSNSENKIQRDIAMAKEGLYPLDIKIPKAMFVGTPKNIKSPNLRKETGKKRPPFYAPKGAANVALGKEISGSDEEPIIGELALITDGDKEGSDGSFVELGPGLQYVQIDLGEEHEIWAIVFWHYHSEGRVYHDVVVQTADDPDFIMNVRTLFNNDHDNSAGLGVGKIDKEYIETNEGYLVSALDRKTAQPTISRYVRLYSNGNTSNELNHYVEVEVYGLPMK